LALVRVRADARADARAEQVAVADGRQAAPALLAEAAFEHEAAARAEEIRFLEAQLRPCPLVAAVADQQLDLARLELFEHQPDPQAARIVARLAEPLVLDVDPPEQAGQVQLAQRVVELRAVEELAVLELDQRADDPLVRR